MKAILSVAAVAALALSSCAGSSKTANDAAVNDETEANAVELTGYWYLENVVANDTISARPAEIDAENPQFVAFLPDSTYAFTTNCNTISGQYEVNGDSIKLTGFMQTRMSCPNMDVEQMLATILPNVNTVEAVNDSVVRLNTSDPAQYIVLRHSAIDPSEQETTEIVRM